MLLLRGVQNKKVPGILLEISNALGRVFMLVPKHYFML